MWPLVGLSDAHVRALAPHDGGEGVDDGYPGHDERDEQRCERSGPAHREQRHRTERKAQGEGTRISEKDARRVEVEAQEGKAGAEERDRERGGIGASCQDGEAEHRDACDCRDTRGEPVEAIDEVDDVRERHEVDDRDGVGEPAEVDEGARDEGVDDASDEEPARGGDACSDDLAR